MTEANANLIAKMAKANFNVEAFSQTNTTWARWVKRFETALELYECDVQLKRQYLLHYMGAATYNVLCDKLLPKAPEEKTYDEIVTILTEHFDPKPNEILENYRFHLRKQKPEETCEKFLVALRKLAINCNFGEYLDTALRNQFVFGLTNQKIQSRLLEKSTLTLKDAVSVAAAYEAAEKGGIELHQSNNNNNSVGVVNKMQSAKRKNEKKKRQTVQQEKAATSAPSDGNKKKSCYRCGSTAHMANECKHKHTVCNFCSIKGHLRKVCMKEKKDVNQMTYENASEAELAISEVLHIHTTTTGGEIAHINSKESAREKIHITLKIDENPIEFELDTGAPVSVMSLDDAKKYFSAAKLKRSDIQLYSYCQTQLDCVGYIQVSVAIDNMKQTLNLYIVRSKHKPLCGREWLKMLKPKWLEEMSTSVVNKISCENSDYMRKWKADFPNLFLPTMGKITGHQVRLNVKENAVPRSLKARRVAFSLMNAVERELDEMVQQGVYEKVDRSEWATPLVVVPKSNGRVRLCGDYKVTLNPQLLVDEHPLPTIDELFSAMSGGSKFSKIDLSNAYLQLEIHEDDRHLLTLSTHKGLYKPTRMMFGVACAPAKWQRFMEGLLSGIPGVSVFLDDIKVTAADDDTHLKRLEEVLRRLNDHNMRVNWEKSEILAKSIQYCGYVIDCNGIRKMDSKIKAIQEMKKPQNKDEVRSFLGLVNYYGRFIQNLSTIVYPLNCLLHNNIQFDFDKKCEEAFNEVKRQIQSDVVLIHFNSNWTVVLAVDASPIGVGAVLSHICPDGAERPIQFASQTLNKVQQRYSQYDREAYAIVFGVKRFYQYLYGRKFTLVTDNKAISQIFSLSKGLPTLSATRMQHYAIFLESFNYDIRLKKSTENANADALSRLPNPDTYNCIEEIDLIEMEAIESLPVSIDELSKYTSEEEELKILLHGLKFGRECEPAKRFNVPYAEFSLQKGCLLRSGRVYIPVKLRQRVLAELHTAHFGTAKMKALARAYCWWPRMDVDIDQMVSNCTACQLTRPEPEKEAVHCWMRPKKVFERVHIDFAGPIFGKYLLILVDAYSKWPEVHILSNITAETTIKVCRQIFATYGIPNIVVSDHGTQFNSGEFQHFLKINGIMHKQGAPYHPATNGQAERFVQTVKQKLKSAKATAATLQDELSKILMAYRRAIHPATNKSPSMLMFGRQMQSRLDLLLPGNQITDPERKIPKKTFQIGDRVAARDYMSSKKWQYGKIVNFFGDLHYEVQLDDNRIWKRHTDQLRKVGKDLPNSAHNNSVGERGIPTNIQPNLSFDSFHRDNGSITNAQDCGTNGEVQSNETSIEKSNTVNGEVQNDETSSEQANTVAEAQDVVIHHSQVEPIRRSQRVRKEPERLQYNKM